MKKITIMFLIVVMITGSLLISCQLDASDPYIGETGTSLGTVDMDGDGTSDGTAIDVDGDGEADGVDTDGDGTIDESWSSNYSIIDDTVTENGSAKYPFLIETAEDLANVGAESTGYEDWSTDSCYKLTADIDLKTSGYSEWTPISYVSGTFDGNGHTISNMVITTSNYNNANYGLFNKLSWGAIVKNLTVSGSITLTDTDDVNIGGIAGAAYGGSTPSGDSAEASTITNCHSEVSINTYGYKVGGLIGYCQYEGVTITGCSASGSVVGGSPSTTGGLTEKGAVGGLLGYAEGAVVSKCYSTGKVSLRNMTEYGGGLVGQTSGTSSYSNCYAQGNISTVDSGTCYYLGGFVGNAAGTFSVTNCYAKGIISGNKDASSGDGFYSKGSSVTNSNCFAMDTTTVSGITTLSETEFKTKSTFTDAGWDFDTVWTINDGNGYPYFQ